MHNKNYLDSARLLVQIAPLVFRGNEKFALKGGSAINLFVRNMPRLSVDLDLVFIDYSLKRNEALSVIGEMLKQSVERINKHGFTSYTPSVKNKQDTKIIIRNDKTEVKVEVNFILRGLVNKPSLRRLTQKAQDQLLADIQVPVVSIGDMYGGKLVAALDRQHPRDLSTCKPITRHSLEIKKPGTLEENQHCKIGGASSLFEKSVCLYKIIAIAKRNQKPFIVDLSRKITQNNKNGNVTIVQ